MIARARGKGVKRSEAGSSRPRRKAPAADAVPEVYQDLLNEVVPSSPTRFSEEGTALKKRRVAGRLVTRDPSTAPSDVSTIDSKLKEDLVVRPRQTAFDESGESSDSDSDSDVAWEEVDVADDNYPEKSTGDNSEDGNELNLVLNGELSSMIKRQNRKHRFLTKIDRELRLNVHKMHILCLTYHVSLRNQWCNDDTVQVNWGKIESKLNR